MKHLCLAKIEYLYVEIEFEYLHEKYSNFICVQPLDVNMKDI